MARKYGNPYPRLAPSPGIRFPKQGNKVASTSPVSVQSYHLPFSIDDLDAGRHGSVRSSRGYPLLELLKAFFQEQNRVVIFKPAATKVSVGVGITRSRAQVNLLYEIRAQHSSKDVILLPRMNAKKKIEVNTGSVRASTERDQLLLDCSQLFRDSDQHLGKFQRPQAQNVTMPATAPTPMKPCHLVSLVVSICHADHLAHMLAGHTFQHSLPSFLLQFYCNVGQNDGVF